MRARKFAVLIALGLVTGACASTQEQRAADANRCRGYGFHRQTDAFARCLLDIDLDRSATRRADLYSPWGGSGWYGPRQWRYGW